MFNFLRRSGEGIRKPRKGGCTKKHISKKVAKARRKMASKSRARNRR